MNQAELNAVVYHTAVVARLEDVFTEDLKYSRKIEYEQWRSRRVLSLLIREQL